MTLSCAIGHVSFAPRFAATADQVELAEGARRLGAALADLDPGGEARCL
ncbi:hypothetical protein [Streptomyces profundus]|nr:hypothetical protein [Streptomyces sp. MA3_2.13]UED88815.1 hypothetical protein K4G22_15790 [Streptomyces sp. MA3_2.13]